MFVETISDIQSRKANILYITDQYQTLEPHQSESSIDLREPEPEIINKPNACKKATEKVLINRLNMPQQIVTKNISDYRKMFNEGTLSNISMESYHQLSRPIHIDSS